MARWLSIQEHGVRATPELVGFLSSMLVFFVCVTKLVALCAAHSSPQVRNRESEPEGELAKEAAVAAERAQSSRKLSQRFSPAAIQAKLRDSFRLSSFRSLNGSFRKSSFRSYGSFRLDCTAQVPPLPTHSSPNDNITSIHFLHWTTSNLRSNAFCE